jgi:hypothetical protein
MDDFEIVWAVLALAIVGLCTYMWANLGSHLKKRKNSIATENPPHPVNLGMMGLSKQIEEDMYFNESATGATVLTTASPVAFTSNADRSFLMYTPKEVAVKKFKKAKSKPKKKSSKKKPNKKSKGN